MMKKILLILLLCGCTGARTVSWGEVSLHGSAEDCWVVMGDQVFDVSSNPIFADSCGGEVVMNRPEFNDSRPDFNMTPPGVNRSFDRPDGFERMSPGVFIGIVK